MNRISSQKMSRQPYLAWDEIIEMIEGNLPAVEIADIYEREVKVMGADIKELIKSLRSIGATSTFSGLVATQKLIINGMRSGYTFKFRKMEELPPVLILKGIRMAHPEYKLRREITWELPKKYDGEKVAKKLGGIIKGVNKKSRRAFTYEHGRSSFHIDIDEIKDKMPIVEIEGASDEAIKYAIEILDLHDCTLSGETIERIWHI